MLTSYHVHSTISDGRDSLTDVVQAAIDAGLDELGISDHYILVSDRRQHNWGMPLDGLRDYWNALQAATKQAGNKLIIRYGIEADYDPRTVDELKELLRPYPFDYIIGSIHFVDSFHIDRSTQDWDSVTQDRRDEVMREYWVRIAEMAHTGLFDIAAHLDLYKKFGHLPAADLSPEISTALDAIAEAGMAVELNTTQWYRPDAVIGEAYPSLDILRECHARGIPTLISSDAHWAQDLTKCFDRAARMLREAGYTQTAIYAGRKMRLAPSAISLPDV